MSSQTSRYHRGFLSSSFDGEEATRFLEGRVDNLKSLHTRWLESLFTGPYDEKYVESLYNVGYVHVKVNLPVEFMAGAMTLINSHLIRAQVETLPGSPCVWRKR